MIKIGILNESEQLIGGGWSFISNFIQGIVNIKADVQLCEPEGADIVFIPSSSMVAKSDTVKQLKDSGKKIVLRVDNATRDSRNRGAGMGKMKRIAEMSDCTIYQSYWAMNYLQPYLQGKNIHVIPNGVNTHIFRPDGIQYSFGESLPVYLYSRFNRDETKCWEKAWYNFQMIYRENPKAKLVIIGKFSKEQVEYNFDFFMGEDFEYRGIITSQEELAKIYRGCNYLMATYYNDCYSNTYLEFLACKGGDTKTLYQPDLSGGTPEILKNGVITIETMSSNYYEVLKNVII